jgi:hypothetical protein
MGGCGVNGHRNAARERHDAVFKLPLLTFSAGRA